MITKVSGTRRGRVLAAALALLLAGPATSLGQGSGDSEEPEESGQSAAGDAGEGDSTDDADTASEQGVVLSPFDYEASESISEDSSVSFPVDI